MRYVGLEHIEPHTMRLLGHGLARDVRSSSVRFAKGDVLYGKMRPYLNKVWVAEFDGLCSAEFLVFPSSEELSGQFLAFRLTAMTSFFSQTVKLAVNDRVSTSTSCQFSPCFFRLLPNRNALSLSY
jgi:type I restriction enzyme S subunit